jgi:hypothetical protein
MGAVSVGDAAETRVIESDAGADGRSSEDIGTGRGNTVLRAHRIVAQAVVFAGYRFTADDGLG